MTTRFDSYAITTAGYLVRLKAQRNFHRAKASQLQAQRDAVLAHLDRTGVPCPDTIRALFGQPRPAAPRYDLVADAVCVDGEVCLD